MSRAHTQTRICACTCRNVRMHAFVCIYVSACVYVWLHVKYVYMCICMYVRFSPILQTGYIHAYLYAYIHSYIPACTCGNDACDNIRTRTVRLSSITHFHEDHTPADNIQYMTNLYTLYMMRDVFRNMGHAQSELQCNSNGIQVQ